MQGDEHGEECVGNEHDLEAQPLAEEDGEKCVPISDKRNFGTKADRTKLERFSAVALHQGPHGLGVAVGECSWVASRTPYTDRTGLGRESEEGWDETDEIR
jgi:hypothetical protein